MPSSHFARFSSASIPQRSFHFVRHDPKYLHAPVALIHNLKIPLLTDRDARGVTEIAASIPPSSKGTHRVSGAVENLNAVIVIVCNMQMAERIFRDPARILQFTSGFAGASKRANKQA
jgi:hypothetical protein